MAVFFNNDMYSTYSRIRLPNFNIGFQFKSIQGQYFRMNDLLNIGFQFESIQGHLE